MLEDFIQYIKDNHLVRKDGNVLIAVSGGIDSMVMADLFLQAGIKTGVAHCNFCLRGRESDGDEELVRRLAVKNKIPFHSKRFKTQEYAGEKGISIQMAARELRYSWFEEIRGKNGYDSIAVAHNMNDNIETVLINLTRGTGIAGLTGMKPASSKIIRPLLFATREKIKKYCRRRKIAYREDRSNAETKYTRNKIRHLVIPVLKEINPSVEAAISETAGRLSGINDIVNNLTEDLRRNLFRITDDVLTVSIRRIKPLMSNRTMAYELFRPYGITSMNLADLYKIMEGRTGGQLFTESYRLLKNRQEIIISSLSGLKNETFTAGSAAQLKKAACLSLVKIETVKSAFHASRDHSTAALDYNKLTFPLIIRGWNPGDFFYPFGMTQKKKLSDYFIDRKYSRIDKEKALVLESGGKIVWIIGERIDNRFRITDATKKILFLKAR